MSANEPMAEPEGERREREIRDAIEAAREYLYKSGMHHQGDFHVMFRNGSFLDLAELMGHYAVVERDAGRAAGLEEAAVAVETTLTEQERTIWLMPAGISLADVIRGLK